MTVPQMSGRELERGVHVFTIIPRTVVYRRTVPLLATSKLCFAGFVFVNVPVLGGHLQTRYGMDFDEHAARTRKLIPFVY